jgi:hypothetical protein
MNLDANDSCADIRNVVPPPFPQALSDREILMAPPDGLPAEFDVFLSHNSAEKPSVRYLKDQLQTRGIHAWLDEGELPPGGSFVDRISDAMRTSRAIAVFFGPAEMGSFHSLEADFATVQGVNRQIPVIPVILPGVAPDVQLPKLFPASTYIRFSALDDETAMEKLCWGITGTRPRKLDAKPVAVEAAALPTLRQHVETVMGALESGNVTYFVGTRTAPLRPDLPPYAFEITRDLVAAMSWVEPAFTGPFLPTLDAAASYYAIKTDAKRLEDAVVECIRKRFVAVPPMQLLLAELLKSLRNRRVRPRRADPRQLVVATGLDVALERAMLQAGVPFSRIVQFPSGQELAINEYRSVEVVDANTLVVSGPTGAPTRVDLRRPGELDDAIRDTGARKLALGAEVVVPGAGNGNTFQSLSLKDLTSPILYKYHGSQDVFDSCTISSDQYFELANSSNIPLEITELIGATPLLFLGCGVLDSDFKHLRHTLLRRAFRRPGASGARIAVQVPPSDEPMDPYRTLEAEIWDRVRDHVKKEMGIDVVEARGEEFLGQLLDEVRKRLL